MVITDVGFVLYWLVTWLHILPATLLIRNYSSSIRAHWNWSFLPRDLAISTTGLMGLWFARKGLAPAHGLMTTSLTLTIASGL